MSIPSSPLSFNKISSIERPKRGNSKRNLRKSKSVNLAALLEKENKQTKPDVKNLVLDLDDTLISLGVHKYRMPYQAINFPSQGTDMTYYVAMRPGLIEFLDEMKELYHLYLYTTSSSIYAYTVLKTLNISGHFKKVYGKEHCFPSAEAVFTKDLQRIGFSLANTIMIDDSHTQALKQQDNTICIKKFKGDPNDEELFNLIPYLRAMAKLSDMRQILEHYKEYSQRRTRDTLGTIIYKTVENIENVKDEAVGEEDANFTEDEVKEGTPSPMRQFAKDVKHLKLKKSAQVLIAGENSDHKNIEQSCCDVVLTKRSEILKTPQRSPQLRSLSAIANTQQKILRHKVNSIQGI